MKDNSYRVGGYVFADEYDYKEAKKEEESVEYIKANANLTDLNKTIKLYNKLVERETFRTVIGLNFLKELRERILAEKILDENSLPCIRVEKSGRSRPYSTAISREAENRYKEQNENLKSKLRSLRIINAFLTLIIAAMILIAVFVRDNSYTDIENEILNKYSAWADELDAREKALRQREAAIEQE